MEMACTPDTVIFQIILTLSNVVSIILLNPDKQVFHRNVRSEDPAQNAPTA